MGNSARAGQIFKETRPENYKELLERLLQERQPKLISFARKKLSTLQEAEDIYSQLIFKTFRAAEEDTIKSYQKNTLVGWMYRTANNLCIDRIRTGNFHDGELNEGILDKKCQVSELEVQDTLDKIFNAINSLGNNYQEPIILIKIQGYTAPEAAAQLNIGVGAVKSRLYRGMRLLRLLLAEDV